MSSHTTEQQKKPVTIVLIRYWQAEAELCAVLRVNSITSDRKAIIGHLRTATAAWIKGTDAGKNAWAYAGCDMNIGDLDSHNALSDPTFTAALEHLGVSIESLETVAVDHVTAYDTVLVRSEDIHEDGPESSPNQDAAAENTAPDAASEDRIEANSDGTFTLIRAGIAIDYPVVSACSRLQVSPESYGFKCLTASDGSTAWERTMHLADGQEIVLRFTNEHGMAQTATISDTLMFTALCAGRVLATWQVRYDSDFERAEVVKVP